MHFVAERNPSTPPSIDANGMLVPDYVNINDSSTLEPSQCEIPISSYSNSSQQGVGLHYRTLGIPCDHPDAPPCPVLLIPFISYDANNRLYLTPTPKRSTQPVHYSPEASQSYNPQGFHEIYNQYDSKIVSSNLLRAINIRFSPSEVKDPQGVSFPKNFPPPLKSQSRHSQPEHVQYDPPQRNLPQPDYVQQQPVQKEPYCQYYSAANPFQLLLPQIFPPQPCHIRTNPAELRDTQVVCTQSRPFQATHNQQKIQSFRPRGSEPIPTQGKPYQSSTDYCAPPRQYLPSRRVSRYSRQQSINRQETNKKRIKDPNESTWSSPDEEPAPEELKEESTFEFNLDGVNLMNCLRSKISEEKSIENVQWSVGLLRIVVLIL